MAYRRLRGHRQRQLQPPGRGRRRERRGRDGARGLTRRPPGDQLPVSHAFHTRDRGPGGRAAAEDAAAARPASARASRSSATSRRSSTRRGRGGGAIIDILARQVASPVQFVKGAARRCTPPARASSSRSARNGAAGLRRRRPRRRPGRLSLFTNHPKLGECARFNQALCGLYAAGLGVGGVGRCVAAPAAVRVRRPLRRSRRERPPDRRGAVAADRGRRLPGARPSLRRLPRPRPPSVYDGGRRAARHGAGRRSPAPPRPARHGARLRRRQPRPPPARRAAHRRDPPPPPRRASSTSTSPGSSSGDDGSGRFETIESPNDVIKLAARAGAFDLTAEFGVDGRARRARRRHRSSRSAAGLDALRDAGIPLVRHYKTTTQGHAAARPVGAAGGAARRHRGHLRLRFSRLRRVRRRDAAGTTRPRPREELARAGAPARSPVDGRATDAGARRDRSPHRRAAASSCAGASPYTFDRRFLFRVLSMGHSQFAELIGARGPNTHVNSACASTTQAFALAEDWIGAGRCRRVVIVAADDATQRPHAGVDRRRLPRRGRGGDRRRRRGGRAAVRPPPPRHAARHGRRRLRRRERRPRRASAACSRSARCWARSPPTAPSTARGSTSTTSAR